MPTPSAKAALTSTPAIAALARSLPCPQRHRPEHQAYLSLVRGVRLDADYVLSRNWESLFHPRVAPALGVDLDLLDAHTARMRQLGYRAGGASRSALTWALARLALWRGDPDTTTVSHDELLEFGELILRTRGSFSGTDQLLNSGTVRPTGLTDRAQRGRATCDRGRRRGGDGSPAARIAVRQCGQLVGEVGKRCDVGLVVDVAPALDAGDQGRPVQDLSLIHISEPTRLGMISYAVFCLK